MTTYNGRRMRRRRTSAELWDAWRPAVITAESIVLVTLVWWGCHLLGMV